MPVGLSKRIPLTIDGSKITEDLVNFPVLIHVSDISGTNETDVRDFFDVLGNDDVLVSENFYGVTLSSGTWDTFIQPNASVSVSDELQLNNLTGNAHSGAHCFTKETFDFNGIIVLTCKWKPHKDHYSTADYPGIHFCAPGAVRETSLYGLRTESYVYFRLCKSTDTTERTEVSISYAIASAGSRTGTLLTSSAINIDETQWHDIQIIMNTSTGYVELDIDEGTYYLYGTVAAGVLTALAAGFVLEFSTVDYNKNNTERFKDVHLIRAGIYNPKGFMVYTHEYGVETPCYTEIQEWRQYSREAWFWTKIPSLSAGVNKQLYLYYDATYSGNTSYVGETGTFAAKQVWDSNYLGVWHMGQDVTTGVGSILDSTANVINADPQGSFTYLTGKIGTCYVLAGTDSGNWINLNDLNGGYSGNVTVEALIRPDTTTSMRLFGDFDSLATPSLRIDTYNLGYWNGADWTTIINSKINSGVWQYVAFTVSGTNATGYYNGVVDTSGTVSAFNVAIGDDWGYGQQYSTIDQKFDGNLGDLRVSSSVRSPAWLLTSYYSDWDNLIAFGAPETSPTYYYHGYVKEYSAPVVRNVKLYERSSGQLMDSSESRASDGYYYLTTTISGVHFIVAFDDDAGSSFNALILDKLQPVGIE